MSLTLAIIPARKGSKSVLRKNLKLLAGYPLIEWTIEAAKGAKLDEIVVTSDDTDILYLAEHLGVRALRRPGRLAEDFTPDLPVAQHALRALGATADDIVVWLRPTSPFRDSEDIDAIVFRFRQRLARLPEPDIITDDCWAGLLEHCDMAGATSIRSVRPAREHPRKMYRGLQHGELWLLPYTSHHWANGPRQELEAVYVPTGWIDIVYAEVVLAGSMEGDRICGWLTPPDRCVDLDTEADFQQAEELARRHGWTPGSCRSAESVSAG